MRRAPLLHVWWLLAGAGLGLAGLALAGQATSQPSHDGSWLGPVRTLRSPAGPASGQPQLQTTARGTVLSWVERAGARAYLRFASYEAGGWTGARTVASGDDWFVNWADVPSVLRLDDGSWAAHWLQKSGGDRYAYDVRLSHSSDDGRTWAPSFTPHHDGTRTEHGFASLLGIPGGGLGVVWLDGRQTKAAAAHTDGHAGTAGAMTLRFGAYDRAWQQVADTPVDLRVCDCCPTAAAITSEGPIVAFRDRSADEVRDIHVSRLEHGRWSEPTAVHHDGWKLAACPVNGPMLGARDRAVVVAWFTAVDDVGHVYVAFSGDAGRTFAPRVRVDEVASLGRVDVEMLDDGTAVVTWIELNTPGASLMARRIDVNGGRWPAVRIATLDGSRTSGYPRMTRQGAALLFAWTDAGAQVVRTATAALLASR